MSKIIFTLKMHYRDADVFFIRMFLPPDNGRSDGGIASYVIENEGNICAQKMCFQCENNINR